MKNSSYNILVVDDDVDIRYAVANILRKCDCQVDEAGSIEESIEELQSKDYDIVFCDMRFHGGLGGEDLLEHMNEHYPNIQLVLISCSMDGRQRADLLAQGAACCLQKPIFRDTFLTVLNRLDQEVKKAA